MKRLALPLLLAPLLAGCTTLAMEGMNGPGACPADMVTLTQTNMWYLENTQPGMPAAALPEPEKKQPYALRSGQGQVEVWYYRTGHSLCRGLPTGSNPYTTVLVDPAVGKILAIGQEEVAAYRPYIATRS
jgi:hypothetical protein